MATANKDVLQTSEVFVGANDAAITLVCYVDYESFECAKLNTALNQLLTDFAGKVRINIRHFPLANKHQKAMKAAEAAVALAQEGLFWDMHNVMFENQKQLGTISLKQYAKQVGTTNKRFLDQVINGVYAWQVREDLPEGLHKGVRSVPAVFVNGVLYEGDVDAEALSQKLKELL